MDKLRELIKSKIKEMSATSQGGASFSGGEGAQYSTPFAFRKNKTAKGPADIYYYKLGFKPVAKIKPKSFDIKKRLNDLYPLVSNAKNETAEYYSENPGSYDILKSTEMILSYLKDIDKLLREIK